MEWQPIATAPRDGTPILTFWKHSGSCVCEYDHSEGGAEGFRSEADDCIPINQDACTHWVPLPAAPYPSKFR